jgi:NADH-quinone oxidoreductase subunit L
LTSAEALGWLLPAVPFLAALAGLLLPSMGGVAGIGMARRSRTAASALGIGGAAVAFVVALILVAAADLPYERSHEWVDVGGLPVTLGVRLDPAAALVAVAVGAVALAVQVYSVAYLRIDERYVPYAAQVSLFTAAMLLVVVSGDLVLLLVGWEVMGICSYLLIGHDRTLPEAPGAAVKAFLVTRVGDVGFLVGIAILGIQAGTFRIQGVLDAVQGGELSPATLTVVALLLLAGVAGKSAQFPLHTWLPDAMAGPTPISALIHAATMVAAGVYVVARLYPVFVAAPGALAVLGVMAAVTLLLGAFAATAQDDIKRVLAWSTVSQIGYMVGALAVGSVPAALFHLLTHAAFKALLFLAAGCVIHAVGSNLMSAMGGLRRRTPVTFWSMVVGLGALAGLPPLAGFWSKDSILLAAEETFDGHGPAPAWVGGLVWLAGMVGVAVTAWYAARLLLLTFFGPLRTRPHHEHEAPGLMLWPVALLAVPSALLGLYLYLGPGLPERLGAADRAELFHFSVATVLPLALLALGGGLAWWLWRRRTAADPAAALGPARRVFAHAFYLDNVQDALVVRPVRALARVVRRADESGVDGAVEGAGRGTLGLGGLLARAHRAGLPRAATAVLAGALLTALAAAFLGGR